MLFSGFQLSDAPPLVYVFVREQVSLTPAVCLSDTLLALLCSQVNHLGFVLSQKRRDGHLAGG